MSTVEADGYVTVYPNLAPPDDAARVAANIAEAVLDVMEGGCQPLSARVCVADYRALLARNGLERRSLRAIVHDALRVQAHGFDLPVDADDKVPADDAHVQAYRVFMYDR